MSLSDFDPSRFAFAFLSECERELILATPRQQLADAAYIAEQAGHLGGGLKLAGLARRHSWLFQRQVSRVNCQARRTACLDYRLSKDGVAVADAIAAAARQGGDVKQAPGEAPQSGGKAASPKRSNS